MMDYMNVKQKMKEEGSTNPATSLLSSDQHSRTNCMTRNGPGIRGLLSSVAQVDHNISPTLLLLLKMMVDESQVNLNADLKF